MGNGIQPNQTRIYIAPVDTNGADLSPSQMVVGEIENWKYSGGDVESEAVPVFGNGVTTAFLDKEKPPEQIELSFDIYVNNTAASTLDRWDIYRFGEGGTSATKGLPKSIFIESLTGGKVKTRGMNNCKAVTWEVSQQADDFLKGTLTFKFTPTTSAAAANMKTSSLAASSAFFNW